MSELWQAIAVYWKGLDIESRLGLIEVERGYYSCACCHSGFFPPGRAACVGGGVLESGSDEVECMVEWAGGVLSCRRADSVRRGRDQHVAGAHLAADAGVG